MSLFLYDYKWKTIYANTDWEIFYLPVNNTSLQLLQMAPYWSLVLDQGLESLNTDTLVDISNEGSSAFAHSSLYTFADLELLLLFRFGYVGVHNNLVTKMRHWKIMQTFKVLISQKVFVIFATITYGFNHLPLPLIHIVLNVRGSNIS